MEIDSTTIFGAVGACAVLGGAVMAYGELKTKVVSLGQRADSAQAARKELFDRMALTEKETEVQKSAISELKTSSGKLFDLAEKHADAMGALNSTLGALKSDIHYMRERMDDVLKRDGR